MKILLIVGLGFLSLVILESLIPKDPYEDEDILNEKY